MYIDCFFLDKNVIHELLSIIEFTYVQGSVAGHVLDELLNDDLLLFSTILGLERRASAFRARSLSGRQARRHC